MISLRHTGSAPVSLQDLLKELYMTGNAILPNKTYNYPLLTYNFLSPL